MTPLEKIYLENNIANITTFRDDLDTHVACSFVLYGPHIGIAHRFVTKQQQRLACIIVT